MEPRKLFIPPPPPPPLIIKQSSTPLIPTIPLPVIKNTTYAPTPNLILPPVPTISLSRIPTIQPPALRLPTVPTIQPMPTVPTIQPMPTVPAIQLIPTVPAIQLMPTVPAIQLMPTVPAIQLMPTVPMVRSVPILPQLRLPAITVVTAPVSQQAVTQQPASPEFYEGNLGKDAYTLFKGLSSFFNRNGWNYLPSGMLSVVTGLVKQSISTNEPIWKILLREVNLSIPNSFTSEKLLNLGRSFTEWDSWVHGSNARMVESFIPLYAVEAIMYLIPLSAGESPRRGIPLGRDAGNVYLTTTFNSYTNSNFEDMVVGINDTQYLLISGDHGVELSGSRLGWESRAQGLIGKLPMSGDIRPPSINFEAFASQLELFNTKSLNHNIPCYTYTLKILNQLRGHFLDGTINIPRTSTAYKVSRAVFSTFSSYFATNFTMRESNGRSDIEFNPAYEAYLIEYIKYLDGDANTLLDISDFRGNFNFAVYIQDRLLAMNQLLVFFDNLEELDFTAGQAVQIQSEITTFLKSLP